MTNWRELLDDASFRPGRLKVQIHIPLSNEEERREIIKIYFRFLREKGHLSLPLCYTIN